MRKVTKKDLIIHIVCVIGFWFLFDYLFAEITENTFRESICLAMGGVFLYYLNGEKID